MLEYWQNNQIDFNILRDTNLKNPGEAIEALLERFRRQKVEYDELLPESKDVGMIKVNTIAIREKLVPTPKKYLDILRDLLPSIVKSRIHEKQEWLSN